MTSLPPWNMDDHIDKLIKTKEAGKYYCPVCNGHNLSINRRSGAFSCWDGCSSAAVREALSPLKSIAETPAEYTEKLVRKKVDREVDLKAAHLNSQVDYYAEMVVNGFMTAPMAASRLSEWAKENHYDYIEAKRLLEGLLGDLAATETALKQKADDLRGDIASFNEIEDPFLRVLTAKSVASNYGITLKHVEDLAAIGSQGKTEPSNMSALVNDLFSQVERRATGEAPPGLMSGYDDLDALTQGFQPGELTILAGRPAMGKTAFLMGVAQFIAEAGKKVMLFSLEMAKEQLGYRILSGLSQIEVGKMRSGNLSEDDWARLAIATSRASDLPIDIRDTPAIRIDSVFKAIEETEERPDIVFIDYLQLLSGPRSNEYENVTYNSKRLKELARTYNIPVVCLSQLNRGVEQRQNKRPGMSDIRESGGVEQDADIIAMLYRDEYYNPDTPDRGIAEVILVKHRNGPTGTVKLLFEGRFTKFYNLGEQALPPNADLDF